MESHLSLHTTLQRTRKKKKRLNLDPSHKVYCHNNFHNFGHKSPTWRFVNREKKKVGLCKFTISPLTNGHIDKLWQSYRNSSSPKLTFKFDIETLKVSDIMYS